jgi:hypothetical protein
MNSWIKGLKEYNKGSDSWCIPKKGSKGYNEIMNKQKPTPKEQKQSKKLLDIDEYNNMARELGRQEMKKRGIYKKSIFD